MYTTKGDQFDQFVQVHAYSRVKCLLTQGSRVPRTLTTCSQLNLIYIIMMCLRFAANGAVVVVVTLCRQGPHFVLRSHSHVILPCGVCINL